MNVKKYYFSQDKMMNNITPHVLCANHEGGDEGKYREYPAQLKWAFFFFTEVAFF